MNRINHTDGVTSIYKQAAQAVGVEDPKGVGDLIRMSHLGSLNAVADLFQVAAAAVWAAYYACDRLRRGRPCAAEHVELVNPYDKSIVFADPSLCERHCSVHNSLTRPGMHEACDYAWPVQRTERWRAHPCVVSWVPLPMEADNE